MKPDFPFDPRLEHYLSSGATEILAALTDGVIISDLDGSLVTMNGPAVRMHDLREFPGEDTLYTLEGDLVPPEHWPLCRILRGEILRSFEVEVRRPDPAKSFFVSFSGSLAHSAEGVPEAAILTLRDTTEANRIERERRRNASELERVQRQLHDAQKLDSLGILAGGVAHDFNNLLTGILGNTNLVLDRCPADDPNRPMLEEVVVAGDRAAALVRQLLAYAGKGRLAIEPVDLSSAIREIADLIHASVPRRIHVAHHLSETLPPVLGDRSQIQQVAMNLILNAAESVPGSDPGTILIETEALEVDPSDFTGYCNSQALTPGTYVSLEVHDTGGGIDDRIAARIFDPFFTTKFAGRGLGLSAVLGIVTAHKGALRVSSRPGHGSSFRVLFPAALGHPAATPPPDDGERKMILVVGRCHDQMRGLAELGYPVLFCDNLHFAESILKTGREPVAVVFCSDAESDSLETDYAAAVHRYAPGVRVLLVSDLPPAEQIRQHSGRRFASFLRTSLPPQKIGAFIQRLFR